ncbi:peptidoglycan-binding protein [Streptomyces sp. RB6PN25]|uniref:Peptidoglycan-binding protein n=1 Tax=Streptomyces humicola TaxID=2953240 RepID=A0ABT1PQ11_9ACTN|nr:peptidoglycan-binding protein [Streptomyces humicola]MCQ4079772.1 peptidoglycan-binding protein [Streptomyces humicola]
MARWKALPGGLDPAVVEFVTQLRRLKDSSALSLRDLAAGTGYSASSWERYLAGRLLPPRAAVQALATMVGADSVRLLAQYEMAQETWRRQHPADRPASLEGTAGSEDAAGRDPQASAEDRYTAAVAAGPTPDRRSRTPAHFTVTALVSAALGAAVAALILRPAGPARPTAAVAHPVSYACTYLRRGGQWYAGNSTTLTDQLEVDISGPDVAELQCLLQHAGISPGGVDGNFGPLTEAAVIQAQKRYHLDIDGQVGPKTWAALRR